MVQFKRATLTVCCLLFALESAFAQQRSVRWGEVDEEQLAMTTYEKDPDAAAVILYDLGEATFNHNFDIEFERHTRIKIISEAGFDLATVRVPYYAERRAQHVSSIRGFTYNLNADGSVERTALRRNAVFHEDADGSYRVASFTLPNLKPGSIIEYRYVLRSNNPVFLPSWTFQNDEPTLHSEYRVELPDIFEYGVVMQGYRRPITERELYSRRVGIFDVRGTRFRYYLQNIPALREEPYVTSMDNYRTRLDLQLARYRPLDGSPPVSFLNTWEKLTEDLLGMNSFGREIGRSREARRKVAELVEGLEDDGARIGAIYDYIRENMEWDGNRRIFSDGVNAAYQRRSGSSADIALLLITMLREAGLTADPVLISTRAHGRVQGLYPMLTQFNNIIVAVENGDDLHLLDATDRHRPASILPLEALNGQGLRVSNEKLGWVDLEARVPFRVRGLAQVRLEADGRLSGNIQRLSSDYAGLDSRQAMRQDSEEQYVKEGILAQISGARASTYEVRGLHDLAEPLVVEFDFESDDYAQVAGDVIYINPFLIDRMEENQFKSEEREFPVDYAAGRDYQYVLKLRIPEGFEVEEYPRSLNMRLPGNHAEFLRVAGIDNNELSIMTTFRINKTIFEPNEYKALREFYDRVVAADAEQLVLRRTVIAEASEEFEQEEMQEEEEEGGQ